MTLEDGAFDPFISRDRIPRTPPAPSKMSSLLGTECSDGAGLRDNSQTSMFQTDENRQRYFIRLTGSPGSQRRIFLRCPSSFNVRSSVSEMNANSGTPPSFHRMKRCAKESSASMDFNTSEVDVSKASSRRGQIHGGEESICVTPLLDEPSCLSLGEMGEVAGASKSCGEIKSQLGNASIASVAFGTLYTSDFKHLGRIKRQRKPTRSSPSRSRHDLRRTTSPLSGSAPRHCRRRQGDGGKDVSFSSTSTTTAISAVVRGGKTGKCHKPVTPPKLTETSSAILGSLGCRRSQRNVARVNYAGL
ncbi:hypothetical protein TcWFU_001086 [Taenia crassiceps]|uniref:Uncharacterized protein n=1 Tax=Taenia crassiceps TaxID=6207 RepID=A0ABR4QA11_9CEST